MSNINTLNKPRQPQLSQHDIKFLSLVSCMKHGELPTDDAILDVGEQYFEPLVSLKEALQEEDGSSGFEDSLQAISRAYPRINALLATIATPDQEETDPRLTTGKTGKKVFRTLSMEDVDNFPDIEWQVSRLLQLATVSMLYGESNTGKTFIALALALSIAYGIPWLGRPVKKGKVLYIYAEGRLGLKPRLRAYLKHHELQPTNNIQFIAVPVHLLHEREFLFNTIAEQEETYSLIVIDTFSNCASGTNQNDQAEVERVLSTCHDITREYGSAVLAVHHTNKQGAFNGTQAFKNHVDTMLEVSRKDDYGPITLHCEKQRDGGERFSDITLQLQQIDLGLNEKTFEPITSCVIVSSNAPTAADRAADTQNQEREKMLAILRTHNRLTVTAWIKECKDVGVSKEAFYKHRPYLEQQNKITYTPPAKNGQKGYVEIPAAAEQTSFEADNSNHSDHSAERFGTARTAI